ncbi:CapA family protein [Streptomyces sp. NPDC002004]
MAPLPRTGVAALAALLLAAAAGCSAEPPAAPRQGSSAGAAGRGFTLLASGDVRTSDEVVEHARTDPDGDDYDFGPMLAAVKPLASRADLAICHTDTESVPRLAGALRDAGYDTCGAGTKRPVWLKAGPAKVAYLSYPSADRDRIVDDARAARRAGADVVVVSLRWGTPWQDEPDASQLALGRQLTASATDGRPDIDLILGTHSHVPQAYEKVGGTWIVYGMGDQIADERQDASGARDLRANESSTARFTFAPPARPGQRWRVTKAEFVPQYFDTDTGRVLDVGSAGANGDSDLRRVRNWIGQAVLSRGAAADGLKMAD